MKTNRVCPLALSFILIAALAQPGCYLFGCEICHLVGAGHFVGHAETPSLWIFRVLAGIPAGRPVLFDPVPARL